MSVRLNIIKSHFSFPSIPNQLDQYRNVNLDKNILQTAYYEPKSEIIHKFHEIALKNSLLFDANISIEFIREQFLEHVLKQLLYIYPKFYESFDVSDTIIRTVFGATLAGFDQSLSTRIVVFLLLFIETIGYLGTSKHFPVIESALKLKQYGCFAMTELGHGSNVAGIEITATFDKKTREFIINSPTPTATKWWIGAAAHTANLAVVFVQLIVESVNCGVHVLLIKIRDDNHNPIPGVIIGDCGAKAGLPGVDNGFLIFRNYRVPYDCLLDRLSSITPEGKFKSSIKSKTKRFGIMISGLIPGRFAVTAGCELNMRNALTIAIRYGSIRVQFGGEKENNLMSYPTHKYRLIPYLAKCFATRICFQFSVNLYINYKNSFKEDPEGLKASEFHALMSVFKPLNARYSQECIQECREACGGHGYSGYSGLNKLRVHTDIHLTWEGDSNILIQQCSRFLLKQIISHFKGKSINSQFITFLNASKPAITPESIKCPKTLIEILEFRTRSLANKSIATLQANASTDQTLSWNNSQVHNMNSLSFSFGEMTIAKEFFNFSQKIKEKDLNTGLEVEKLFKLYVVAILEKNFIGFNEEEYEIIQNTVVELSNDLAKSAVKIIDIIAVPDHILGSPLGASDGRVYERYTKEVECAPRVYDKPSYEALIKEMKTLIN